jgi:uncharacterized membrane protein
LAYKEPVAIRLKYRSPSGETRPWTLKEIIQGKPVDRPTHPMVIHFPIAFWIGALCIDVISRPWRFPSAPLMATWLILGGLIGFVAASTTGLVDRSVMRPGSRIRALATRHMLVQYTATAIFVVDLALRWSDRHAARSSFVWIALDLIGVLTVMVGADLGGQMVFKMGYRVGPGED